MALDPLARPAHGGRPGEVEVRPEAMGETAMSRLAERIARVIPEDRIAAIGNDDDYLVVLLHPSVPKDVILVVNDPDGTPYKITIQPHEE